LISGAVSFERPEQAEAAKSILEREGYDVDLQPQRDGSVVLGAGPSAAALAPTASALVARLKLLAHEFGGSFMGYGELRSTPLRDILED
jgi:hypothetical protein